MRLKVNEPARKYALYRPEHGHRKRGRTTLSFDTYIAGLLTDTPELMDADHIVQLAQDRELWRKLVAGAGAY